MAGILGIIYGRLSAVYPTLNNDEQKVLYPIWKNWDGKTKITQREIARQAFGIGHHEVHEEGLPIKKDETTLRKVRQVIRDLRILHGVPILSDRDGYWLPTHLDECKEYLERIEAMARAQAAAWHETYRAMEATIGIRSEFFENQRSLAI